MKSWLAIAAAFGLFYAAPRGSGWATGAFVVLGWTVFIVGGLKLFQWLSERHSRKLYLADCDYEQWHATAPTGDRSIALFGRHQPAVINPLTDNSRWTLMGDLAERRMP